MDEQTPFVVPARTANVISGVRDNAAIYDNCVNLAATQARESVERGIIGHAPDGTPTPPDPALFDGTNAQITPDQFLQAGLAAQVILMLGEMPADQLIDLLISDAPPALLGALAALGTSSPNKAIRRVRS